MNNNNLIDVIWIRITKSGGTSIYKKIKTQINNILTPTKNSHEKFKLLNKDKLIFANIREPFAKIYSAYNFLIKGSNNRCKDIIKPHISFYEFLIIIKELRETCEKYDIYLYDGIYCTDKLLLITNLNYQVYWILSHTESNINSITFFCDKDKVKLIKVDENFDKNIQEIFPNIKFDKLNKQEYKKIKYEDLDNKCKELFNILYQSDIDFYNSV